MIILKCINKILQFNLKRQKIYLNLNLLLHILCFLFTKIFHKKSIILILLIS